MILAPAAVVVLALTSPFLLPLERVGPATAATLWFASLLLRAATAAFAAVFVVLYVPTTQAFSLLTHWCWHAALPFAAAHLGLSGHQIGDVALVAPAFFIALSVASVCVGLWRAARRIRALLGRLAIGSGPGGSLVVGDTQVVVAATGLRRPRVIVSSAALATMDDEELAASLDHERGHIARRHRWVLTVAELCRALARFVPGTSRGYDELLLALERDADAWALRRRHDPAALASAICKAARSRSRPVRVPALALSGSDAFTRRVEELLDGPPSISRRADRLVRAVAVLTAVLTLGSLAALPVAATAGVREAARAAYVPACRA